MPVQVAYIISKHIETNAKVRSNSPYMQPNLRARRGVSQNMTQSKLFGQMFSVWSGLPGGLSGAATPDRGPGVSPGFPLLSLAACGGEPKKEKEVFRGHPEPRQRAGCPLQSRLGGGLKHIEQTFRKFALCHEILANCVECRFIEHVQ